MRFLGISGSLRAQSLNTRLLRSTIRIAPQTIEVELYGELGSLPLFNSDLEPMDPAPVAQLRARVLAADALIIASPEYAHGVSGVLKNALDWMVGNESFVDKPVALFNASPRAQHAQAALRETLQTMSSRIVPEACICVPLLGSALEEEAIVKNPAMRAAVLSALVCLEAAVLAGRPGRGAAFHSL